MTLEKGDKDRLLMSEMFVALAKAGAMTAQQMQRGFEQMVDIVDGLVCDVPKAKDYFAAMHAHAHQHGLLPSPAPPATPVVGALSFSFFVIATAPRLHVLYPRMIYMCCIPE